ncbi:MAG: lytic transglycosylase domain-containing protein [Pigmentiphaga sp.]
MVVSRSNQASRGAVRFSRDDFRRRVLGSLAGLLLGSSVQAGIPAQGEITDCLAAAARHFGLPSALLHAIAEVESGGDPRAVNRANRDGSRDIGLMQINSRWLPRLARWRIDEQALFDPCISAHVGAWILADNITRLGPVWRAVGAYNARTPALQLRYVRRVQAALEKRAATPDTQGGPPARRGPHPP